MEVSDEQRYCVRMSNFRHQCKRKPHKRPPSSRLPSRNPFPPSLPYPPCPCPLCSPFPPTVPPPPGTPSPPSHPSHPPVHSTKPLQSQHTCSVPNPVTPPARSSLTSTVVSGRHIRLCRIRSMQCRTCGALLIKGTSDSLSAVAESAAVRRRVCAWRMPSWGWGRRGG